ncbi:MAG: phage tail assembly protein [Cyanobacteria bacterium J06641_5]
MGDRNCLEFEFTLPKGAIVGQACHVLGKMRLATGQDEISAREHPLARANPHYAWLVLLARVIVRLGSLDAIEREHLENLPIADNIYLKTFYRQINPWQGDDSLLGESPFTLSTGCIGRWH